MSDDCFLLLQLILGSVEHKADELLRHVQASQFVAAYYGEVCPTR